MKRAICATVAVILILSAAACSKSSSSESDDPFVGKWNAVSINSNGLTIGVGEALAGETWLQLNDEGTCTVMIDGNSSTGEWSIFGGIVRISAEGQNLVGVIDNENAFIVLDMSSTHGMTVNFAHQDGKLAPHIPEPEPEPPPYGWRSSNPMEWWDGEWFGYMTLETVSEGSEPLRHTWDCFGTSQHIANGVWSIHLWDEGMTIGSIQYTVDFGGGSGERGIAVAHGGILATASVSPEGWTSDPEHSRYKDQFVIEVRDILLDINGYTDYTIVLRPWGMLWDDVPANETPPGYERYLELYRRPLAEADIPDHTD